MNNLVRKFVAVRKSCLTGRAVWIYQGKSRAGASQAYARAFQREIRVRENCENISKVRAKNILSLLTECLSTTSVFESFSIEKKRAIETLKALSAVDIEYDCTFYNHYIEERSRKFLKNLNNKKPSYV